MLIAILHHLPDADDPDGIVAQLVAAMAPGSYLVLSHPAKDIDTEAVAEVQRRYNARVPAGQQRRSFDEVYRLPGRQVGRAGQHGPGRSAPASTGRAERRSVARERSPSMARS
jgi:hypothetical protein